MQVRPFYATSLLCSCLLLSSCGLTFGADRKAPTPISAEASMFRPCHIPTGIDTAGWVTIRLYGDGRRILYQLPPSFHEDHSIHFTEGGVAWTDGRRRLTWSHSNYTCVPDAAFRDCAECYDSLAGTLFRVDTAYQTFDSLYCVYAGQENFGTRLGLHALMCTSPYSADQNLFLTIVRTMRDDSRVARRGHLFMGGHRFAAPYVITSVEDRLVINGYMLPDVGPPSERPPDTSAELETRRSIKAGLRSYRDSLLASGMNWPRAKEFVLSRAREFPQVRSAGEVWGDRVQVVWGSGFQYLSISKRTGLYESGGKGSWEQYQRLIADRLDHLQSLLEKDDLLFLLGGGSEFVVESGRGDRAVEIAERISRGEALEEDQAKVLPEYVRAQLLRPLELEPAR